MTFVCYTDLYSRPCQATRKIDIQAVSKQLTVADVTWPQHRRAECQACWDQHLKVVPPIWRDGIPLVRRHTRNTSA